MPNFQSLTVSDTSYDGTLFVRTVVPDSDDAPGHLLFQTTRGKSIWLPPADCRDLIAWMHHVLGDGLFVPAAEVLPYSHRCQAEHPQQGYRCIRWRNHQDELAPEHEAETGATW